MRYNVFMLALDESQANHHFEVLKQFVPTARLVQGVQGLYQAHKKCASNSMTDHFFVVDADVKVLDGTVFNFSVPDTEKHLQYTHLWYNQIPAIDRVYGYGGIKLLPKAIFKAPVDEYVDLTTSMCKGLVIHNDVPSVCNFHLDDNPFVVWRSAFREAYKLCISSEADPAIINGWLNIHDDVPNAKLLQHAVDLAVQFAHSKQTPVFVNDYRYLQGLFLYHTKDMVK